MCKSTTASLRYSIDSYGLEALDGSVGTVESHTNQGTISKVTRCKKVSVRLGITRCLGIAVSFVTC
jgi:hypothetical protein